MEEMEESHQWCIFISYISVGRRKEGKRIKVTKEELGTK